MYLQQAAIPRQTTSIPPTENDQKLNFCFYKTNPLFKEGDTSRLGDSFLIRDLQIENASC